MLLVGELQVGCELELTGADAAEPAEPGPRRHALAGRGEEGRPAAARPVRVLVERFDIEPFSDFSAK